MKIGQRLRSAMKRAGLNQKELARRSGIHESTISSVMSGQAANPNWETVETLVNAIGTTWGDLFDEPRVPLSEKDCAAVAELRDIFDRLLANDAAQKLSRDEVELWPAVRIPEAYGRAGARQSYRVLTDAMTGLGILENSMIFARPAADLDAADGDVAVVRFNGTLYLRRVDLRGKKVVLTSENPRYADLHVGKRDVFELVAVVVI
jgi:transcriptional regulator with XRE-family HTH domain